MGYLIPATVTIVLVVGIFSVLFVAMPAEFFAHQPDFELPVTQDRAVVDYYSANNLTVYENQWSFTLTFPGAVYNQSGLPDGHRVEVFWIDHSSILDPDYSFIQFKHAYPSPLGSWWLWSNLMVVQEPEASIMGYPEQDLTPPYGFIDKTQLLRLAGNDESAFFSVSDGDITQNFAIMSNDTGKTLSESWDDGALRILSSYGVDFDAMKPNAFWLMAQLIFFQNPDFGLPGLFGQIVGYGISLAFWIVIALLLYSIVTRLIPTIQGGIEQ